MIVFPNCKINLGLNILRKRSDGYHDIETIFYPIPLTDALEIIENKSQNKNAALPFTSSGLPIIGNPDTNLCVKAYQILKKDFPNLPAVFIYLHKIIPIGAGLGGGSADGAFAMKAINEMFALGVTTEQLITYSLNLGSDCPFFIINKPCFATGQGEKLEEIAVDLSAYKILIVSPGIHIDTGRAFLNITPATPERSIKEIITDPIEHWKDILKNDFEKQAFKQYPEIFDIKNILYHHGAIYASMTGTGSTVFGIFPAGKKIEFSFPENYFVKELQGGLQ